MFSRFPAKEQSTTLKLSWAIKWLNGSALLSSSLHPAHGLMIYPAGFEFRQCITYLFIQASSSFPLSQLIFAFWRAVLSLNKKSTNRMIAGDTIRITGTTIGKANDHDRSQTCQNPLVRPRFIKTTVKETIPVVTMPIKKAKTTLRPRLFLIVDCSCLTFVTRPPSIHDRLQKPPLQALLGLPAIDCAEHL